MPTVTAEPVHRRAATPAPMTSARRKPAPQPIAPAARNAGKAKKAAVKRPAKGPVARRARAASPPVARRVREGVLPGWAELGVRAAKAPARASRWGVLDAVPSLRFGLLVVLACGAVTLFVGHVYATQATVAALQTATRENLQLHLKRDRLAGVFDQLTGPDAVIARAATLGLEEGVAYGETIELD